MVLTMNEHPNDLLEAEGIIGDEGTSNLSHPCSLPLPQTVVLKLQCHLSWTAQMDPDIPDGAEGIEKKCV